jgi:Zn-dependent M28 family amino/carboxypeptidase
VPAIDRERVMRYLQQICAIGPRKSGSEGMTKQQDMLKQHLEALGAKVEMQRFNAKQRSIKNTVAMANLIARWYPERQVRVIICSHYDTRPIADQEPDERRWLDSFVSANDGGSGVALLMELAHHVAKLNTTVGIDFVCFDGEEFIFDNRAQEDGGDKYFFGSEHFAQEYRRSRVRDPKPITYRGAVLLDMIAGVKPSFYYEQYSAAQAGPLMEKVWQIAAEVGAKSFVPRIKHAVRDDHLALLQVGIPAVDIIDFDYPHWHRLTDVPANCSADGLEQVGKVLMVWLQRVK